MLLRWGLQLCRHWDVTWCPPGEPIGPTQLLHLVTMTTVPKWEGARPLFSELFTLPFLGSIPGIPAIGGRGLNMKQQLTSSTGGLRLAGAGRQWEAVGGSGRQWVAVGGVGWWNWFVQMSPCEPGRMNWPRGRSQGEGSRDLQAPIRMREMILSSSAAASVCDKWISQTLTVSMSPRLHHKSTILKKELCWKNHQPSHETHFSSIEIIFGWLSCVFRPPQPPRCGNGAGPWRLPLAAAFSSPHLNILLIGSHPTTEGGGLTVFRDN